MTCRHYEKSCFILRGVYVCSNCVAEENERFKEALKRIANMDEEHDCWAPNVAREALGG